MLWPTLYERAWNPWNEIDRLQRELNKAFGGAGGRGLGDYPAVNIWTSEDGGVLTAELPGVQAKDLEVSVKNETVTIRGKREIEALKKEHEYIRRERGSGTFVRSFAMPFRINANEVKAKVEKGILTVSLPRLPEDKPSRIAVKAS